MAEYKVGRRATECAATNQPFAEGQDVVSAIFDGEDGFERRDYDAVAFEGVEESYSFWRGRIPVAREEQHRLDFELALEFFARLVRDNEPEHMGLRFLLALLLGRKRRVKLKGFSKRDGVEYLNCVVRGDEEDEELSLEVPRLGKGGLDEEGRAALQSDLNRLFGVEEPCVSADVTAEESASAEMATDAADPVEENTVEETGAVGAGGDSEPL